MALRHYEGSRDPTIGMVTTFEMLGLLVLVLFNTTVAALMTRFFRVRLHTRWGSAIYTALGIPFVLVVLTMLVGSVVGPNLGSPATVIVVTVVTPASLGVAFDYFWMPDPEEVDLPDKNRGRRTRR